MATFLSILMNVKTMVPKQISGILLKVTQPIISLSHSTNIYESHFDESGY